MIWLENLNKEKRTGEVGLFLGSGFQGKGYASKALQKMINYGFNKLKLKKIVALTNNFNKNSQDLMQRNGFKLVRKIKKDYREKFSGKWCDVLIYGIKE
jgi:[ribosomal protein S5]-alanine N-acetyltransferase